MGDSGLFSEGVHHFQSGRLLEAEAFFRQILDTDPEDPDALHMLGLLAMHGGDAERGAGLIEEAIRGNRRNAQFYTHVGECYRLLGRLDAAIRAQRRALKLKPDFAQAYCNLGSALDARGQTLAALKTYRKAIAIDPTLAQAHYNLGNLLTQKGDIAEAARAFRRSTEASPNFADGHYNLGNSLVALGDLKSALAAFRRVIEINPDFASAHFNLANALRASGDLDSAREAYLQALAIDPTMAVAHVNLAIVAKRNDRLEEAGDHCLRSLTLDPNLPEGYSNLGHIRLLQEDAESAIALFQRAIDLDPDFAAAYLGLAAALRYKGLLQESLEAARKGLSIQRLAERPARKQAAVKVLVLKGIEDGNFTIGPYDNLALFAGMNNADTHFDVDTLAQCDFFLDGLDPERLTNSIPPCDVIFNAVSDVDSMPKCHEIAKALSRHATVPVINHPEAIEATRRDRNYEHLNAKDGIAFPKTLRLDAVLKTSTDNIQMLRAKDLQFPLLVRRAGTHTGESLQRVEDWQQIEDYILTNTGTAIYVSEFIDFSQRTGLFTKMRMFAVDGELFPVHLFISQDWYVRGHDDARRMMLDNKWMIDEKLNFLSDPESYLGKACYHSLQSIPKIIHLDYFGIDFAKLPDGRLLVFEANAVMNHHYNFVSDFPFQEAYLDAVTRALNGLLRSKIGK